MCVRQRELLLTVTSSYSLAETMCVCEGEREWMSQSTHKKESVCLRVRVFVVLICEREKRVE